jgi:nucleotide-binding universal stress UspA family protein
MKLQHVLVPLDHSDLAEAALDYAIDIVDPRGRITLLMVVDQSMVIDRDATPVSVLPGPNPMGHTLMAGVKRLEISQSLRDSARDYLEQVAASLWKPGWSIEPLVEEGQPADRILAVAEEMAVDAIVMSTHGRSGLSRWVMGSVAQKVLCAATCPVFLVPQRAVAAADRD